MSSSTLSKLLAALNECTEWGQVFILDALAFYTPGDGECGWLDVKGDARSDVALFVAREAENIIERVVPRLQHANSAVVLSAVKVVMKYMEQVEFF